MFNNQDDFYLDNNDQEYFLFNDDKFNTREKDNLLFNEINFKIDKVENIYNFDTGATSNQVSELPSNLSQKNENEKINSNIIISENVEIKKNEIYPKNTEKTKNLDNLPKTKNFTGKKRNNSDEKIIHNKYSEDNVLRKIKSTLLNILLEFINNKINKIYNGDIGQGIFKKKLLKNDQSQIKKVKQTKEFLYKKLKDIFSFDISKKYTNVLSDYNKIIIKNLLNENDIKKKLIIKKIFNLTFLDCLNHFKGSKKIDVLEGLKNMDEVCMKFEDDSEYIELFKYSINNMEDIIMRKKSRNKIKNKDK